VPGFGSGPWGHFAFGEWWWSHYVLYDLIPSIYREKDTSGFLEKFSESLRPSFDQLRRKIRNFGEMRDPLLARSATSESQTLRLGKRVVSQGGIEQSGVDGKVTVLGEFSAATARFTEHDRGKLLTIQRSSIAANNTSVTIVSVIDNTTVTVTPRTQLDAGLLRWDVRQVYKDPPNRTTVEVRGGGVDLGKVRLDWLVNDGYAAFDVLKRSVFAVPADERRLLTERDGEKNGTIDVQGRLSVPLYLFSAADVGKVVFIAGSVYSANNGRFEILGVDRVSATDYRAVFSRLDIDGFVLLTGAFDATGSVRYANKPGKLARVWHKQAGVNTPLTVAVSGEDITVNLATDSLGRVASTAAAVAAAVTADLFASPLVTSVASGAGTGWASATDTFLDVPGVTLQADSNLTWAMAPFGQLVLKGPPPKGVVEVDGTDGYVQPISATQGVLKTTASALFRAGDVGKLIVLRGSQVGNDGTFAVVSIPIWGAGAVVVLDGVFGTEPAGQTIGWEMRTKSGQANQLEVEATAPPMLNFLAQDFGIEVDTQESEVRQRSWVKYVNQWVDKKGLDEAYQILANISGYKSTVAQLFAISFDISQALPSIRVFEIADVFAADGSLSNQSGPDVTLTSTAALFSVVHVGRYVSIRLAASAMNNQLFEVIGFIDAQNLRLRATGATPVEPVAPDANNGALAWSVIRLYTDVPPTRPVFDDFDSDAMSVLIPSFTVDSYCWEQPIRVGNTTLDYKTQTGPFVVGENITGLSSAATAVIVADANAGDTGTLTYTPLTGVFLVGETLVGSLAGSAEVSVAPTGGLNIVATAEQVDSSFVWVDGDISVVLELGIWGVIDSLARTAFLESIPVPVNSAQLGAGNSAVAYVGFDPAYGWPIRVSHVNPGPANPFTTVAVTYGVTTDVVVTLATDGGGAVIATAQEVVTAVQNDFTTAGLLGVSAYPGNGTGLAPVSGPVLLTSNGVRRTSIASTVPVALGPASLEYFCEPNFSCDYCVSYRVLLELELDTLANEQGVALERVFERTMERMKDVTPVHVQLVPRLIQPLTATLNLTASIEPVEVLETLYAPLSYYYDETPADGELTGVGDAIGGAAPTMTLTDATALFSPALVGLNITITGATTAANNGTFLITAYTSFNVIEYSNPSGVAEAFTGTWGVVLYEPDSPPRASITTP
jgi:hypothetical protein